MKKIRILILIAVSVIFVIVVGIRVIDFVYRNKTSLPQKEHHALSQERAKLHNALKAKNSGAVYHLFNETFRTEIDSQKFNTYLDNWFAGRKVSKVKLQRAFIFGRGGHATTWIMFNNNTKELLYQSWIRTINGWKLMWLTKVLPRNLYYGETHLSDNRKIQEASLEKLIIDNSISQVTADLKIPNVIIIKLADNTRKKNYYLPGYTIYELTNIEIKRQAQKLGALFYLEFGNTRIIEDVASCYIGIVPIKKNIPQLYRIRGEQFYYVKENGIWNFDSYGTKW